MAATEDPVRQAVDLDNLIQEYMQFEKVSLNVDYTWRRTKGLVFLVATVLTLSNKYVTTGLSSI